MEGLIPSKEEGGISCLAHLHKLFVFGIMWSLGALLELENREKLESFLRTHESKLDLPQIPKGTIQTMYEFFVSDYGKWEKMVMLNRFRTQSYSLRTTDEMLLPWHYVTSADTGVLTGTPPPVLVLECSGRH